MDKDMVTAHERAALDRLDAARKGLSEVWSLIRKWNRSVEDEEAIARANVEMATAAKGVKRLLEGRAVRTGRIEFLRAEFAARNLRTPSAK